MNEQPPLPHVARAVAAPERTVRPATTPPSGVRFEAALLNLERLVVAVDAFFASWLPAANNPLAHPGQSANLALSVAIGSGVALLLWYSPSLQFAYSSLAEMGGGTLGGWVRAAHRYSSDLAMLLALIHAGRVFLARKFTEARWLPWVSGVGLIALIWFIGWTGYWLVWDQPAQQVAVSSMGLLDALPVFGEPLGRLYVADRMTPSLLFFVVFFLHMLLPLGIAVGLAVHVMRISRAKLFPNWRITVSLSVGLAAAALLFPAPLDPPAQMAWKAPAFTVDAWYLTPLALALRFQHAGLWVALFGTTAVAAAVPWLLRQRRPGAYQAVVEPSRCHACTQCAQDCPFDAITMVARTDGKPFRSQASVDPSRCVGCGVCAGSCDSEGIVLPWFNTQPEETRLAAEIMRERASTGPACVALIAGDIDHGGRFARWRDWLPHYQVHVVPTASWVRPKFIEHLLSRGVPGVLVVRDARVEAAARDGNRWALARLAGERKPYFRPERAGGSKAWQVLDFDPFRPDELTRAADRFRTGATPESSQPQRRRIFGAAVTTAILTLGIAAAVIVPSRLSVSNPAPSGPEFVFSFKALGDYLPSGAVDPAAEAKKPVHMRGRATAKPHRAAIVIRLTVDGMTQERSYAAKGISHDGPALDQWRRPLAPGRHDIVVEIITGPASQPLRWSGTVQAEPRRLHVLTFEPDHGFRVE
ncbi:MAG: Cytochrome b6 [Verrucomicrobiota bacterium]|jgi:quinol-cytochrome oxidoreductase complex cytochrome b subunit